MEYSTYWFTYSSANRPCGLDSLWTLVKVIHSLTGWLATWPVCIGLAECLPWGSQPPFLAGMRPDRGVVAVGNLPPIPLHCLSEHVSERVEECRHICDGMGERKTACKWAKLGKSTRLYFISSYLNIKSVSQNVCMRVKRSSCYSVSLNMKSEVMNLTKGGRVCSQLKVAVKVVFMWYMLAPSETRAAKTREDQVKSIVFTSENGKHFQRPQVLTKTKVNWYCCCKWYGGVPLLTLNFCMFWDTCTETHTENSAALTKVRWYVACCYRCWW